MTLNDGDNLCVVSYTNGPSGWHPTQATTMWWWCIENPYPPPPPAIVLTNGSTVWYHHSLRYHLIKRFSLLDFFWYFTWWAPEVQCESSSQLIKQFTTFYLGCCLFLPFITFLLCLLNNSIDRAWNKPRCTCRWPLPDLPQVKVFHTDTGNAASAVDFTIALDFKLVRTAREN